MIVVPLLQSSFPVSYTHLDVYKRQLLECLVMNADPEHDADFYEFDLKTVTEYRKKMLSAPVKDGKAVLEMCIRDSTERVGRSLPDFSRGL